MNYSPIIEKAIRIASYRHRNQSRKYPADLPTLPYISHLFSVALILTKYTNDENIIVGGILHDIIEDTDYKISELEKDFGEKIKNIVLGVTEKKIGKDGKPLPWEERKNAYLELLKTDSIESMMICAADKIHNITTYINYDETKGNESDNLWNNFNASKDLKIKNYGDVLTLLKERLNNPIVQEYELAYEQMKNIFNKP